MAPSASFEVHLLSLFIGAVKKKNYYINPELSSLVSLTLTNLMWVTLLLTVDKNDAFVGTGANISLRSFGFDWH